MTKSVAETIGDVEVERVQGPVEASTVQIKSFWQDQVVVVQFLRRFGCKLCRGHAVELEQIVPALEAKGVRVVAIGIEKFGLEEFQEGKYWNGELYIDNGKKALTALDIKQVSWLTTFKDLFFNKEVSEAEKKTQTQQISGNLKGDGRQLGGTFVFAKGGEVLLDFRQRHFGDQPSNEVILKAAGIDPSEVAKSEKEAPFVGMCTPDPA